MFCEHQPANGVGDPQRGGGQHQHPTPIVGLAQAVFFFEHIAKHTVSDYNVHFFIVGSPRQLRLAGVLTTPLKMRSLFSQLVTDAS
jgi:hypothetical protein